MAGWSFQWICQLSLRPRQLDGARSTCGASAPRQDTTDATIDQVRRLVDRLPADGEVPLFVFDAGYDPIALAHGLADTRAQVLCRIRDDRVFYPTHLPDHTGPTAPAAGRPATGGG